ncbi:ABC transporter ATP-binding protein [Halapricum desulfuricans]|uniref:ABC-type multidrug transport system, ATPase component n=1 Tax=Halapricum desulfuricans TaxID=2841257 RepID=A0A897N8N3_9EURY|nr:ABC transporter ATP-binding protein [Halapricum desulfuricans]QSG09162.1 ABC-type multidrug transport system, ATPase component [Halapricum desulfuricans]
MTDRFRVENLTKDYGPVVAVDGVDLSIEPGVVHCLAGPNGSGKSTLLGVLLGLVRPTEGTVVRPASDRVGASFQEPAFYDDLTVRENLDVFRALAGDPAFEWVQEVIGVFNLSRVLHRRAAELSGGYSKQLDLALALLNEPDFLLLDEPLADLDDVTRESLVAFLERYAAEGNAVVVSSHRIDAFAPVLDRLTVMYEGEIVLDGQREEIDGTETIRRVYREAIAENDKER